jgi:hypothetical protein
MADADESESLLAYAGIGGAGICCLGIELLGGAAILGGLAATVGLSIGLTYLLVAGIGGLFVALAALGYRRIGGANHV